MPAAIRQATSSDAPAWIDLAKSALGMDYHDRQVYDPAWVAAQLDTPSGHETWVAEESGRLMASITVLGPFVPGCNPVANLGRDLFRREALASGAAAALLGHVNRFCGERGQIAVLRVLASDNARQSLVEQQHYCCVGFQPYKHMLRTREGVLFYVHMARPDLVARSPVSESLSQVSELAGLVLGNLGLGLPAAVRDGATGYPLQTDVAFSECSLEDFRTLRLNAQPFNPPAEVSGGFNIGAGLLRIEDPAQCGVRALSARRGDQVVAGVAYVVDDIDRCVRVVDAFAIDDLSPGALLQRVVKLGQEKHNAIYIEVDILITAPRLLKSVEQLGFVPVAYLPGFCFRDPKHVDVVKLAKLNLAYGAERAQLTTHARSLAEVVDRSFQDQKVGVAIIGLLRGLPIFEGLGDGELRKISRLFTQRLYRPGERLFSKGDSGNEAFVVMRGQVDILREEQTKPLASFGSGQILGEIAFLDGAARTALAVAAQPSILLVMQRPAFNELVQREPHLGMVVMRNVAIEVSRRLRSTTSVPIAPPR
jgi:hypothetical protein